MNREQALEMVFNHNKGLRSIIDRLCKWDEGLTIVENAAKIGCSVGAVRTLRYRYNLKCDMRYLRSIHYKKKSKKDYADWDSSKTLDWNAKKLGLTYNHARIVAKKFGLAYFKERVRGRGYQYTPQFKTSKTRQRVQELKKLDLNECQIADVLGVSRQLVNTMV